MALGLFDTNIDTIDDVLAIRARALELVKEGSTVMSWGAEGNSVTKQWTLPVRTVLEETKIFLQQYDPDLYGKRITRTSPLYLS